VAQAQSTPLAATANWDCFCEVPQLEDEQLQACRDDISDEPQLDGKPVSGFCYVDATTDPPTGNPALVENCPETEQHLIRLVGAGRPSTGATVFMTCSVE
jgi:hypothetical protein